MAVMWSFKREEQPCPCCCGTGKQTRHDGTPTLCSVCNGTGVVKPEEKGVQKNHPGWKHEASIYDPIIRWC